MAETAMFGDDLAAALRHRGGSPDIIERVSRMNPDPKPGERLRGLYRKSFSDPRWMWGVVSKGAVIRQFGRPAFERIPRKEITKMGRRVYVRREAIEDRVWEISHV